MSKVAKAKETLPTTMSFEDDAGAGFEAADVDSFAVPFLSILQKNSPQVDEAEGAYIEGAKASMIFNTVTNELFESVVVVPCAYRRQYLEWKPRNSGGGLVNVYDVTEGAELMKQTQINPETGKLELPNGNTLADTRMHYCMQIKPDGGLDMVVISMSSTQVKKSRKWMTIMNNCQGTRQDGSRYTLPMFANKFALGVVPESNEKGNWYGWQIERLGLLSAGEESIYELSKQFRDKVVEGKAKPVQDVPDTATEDEEL